MELAQGGSLRRALDDELQALPWLLRSRLLLEVAEGMRHLHRADAGHRPIVHRDLKAANVLLSSADLPRAVSAHGGGSECLAVQGARCARAGRCAHGSV